VKARDRARSFRNGDRAASGNPGGKAVIASTKLYFDKILLSLIDFREQLRH